jgi:hypothetical protein
MNTFPEEVLYNILTHLPPGYMLLVNKHINSLHNELYYKEILEKNYHDLKLKLFSTWKELYLRSREEGCVNFNNAGSISSLSIKGTKCLTYEPLNVDTWNHRRLLLRFNGDLLLLNTIIGASIIDTGVSDICSSGYIKGNKFYGLFDTDAQLTTQLLAESTDPFLFISGDCLYICAATQTELYLCDSNDDQKCLSKSFDFKIKAIETSCIGDVDVLLDTGKLVVLDRQLLEISRISDILNINSNFIQTTQQYLLLPPIKLPIVDLKEQANMKSLFDDSIKLSLNSFDKVINSFIFMSVTNPLILDKQGLFSIKADGSIIKIKTDFKIKRICDRFGHYWICELPDEVN